MFYFIFLGVYIKEKYSFLRFICFCDLVIERDMFIR